MQRVDEDNRVAEWEAGFTGSGTELANEIRLIGYREPGPADPCRKRSKGAGRHEVTLSMRVSEPHMPFGVGRVRVWHERQIGSDNC